MSSDAVIERVTRMVAPLIGDLKLDLYDIEFRGGTLRVTIDTPPGSPGGVDIDTIALVTRMISRDFDHDDPMPGSYTLEVSSPGLERTLRTPEHFVREIGKDVAFRLRDVVSGDRRVQGLLLSATESDCTIRLDDAALTERTIAYGQIDRAKTVFVFPAQPKPTTQPKRSKKAPAATSGTAKSGTAKSGTAKSGAMKSGPDTAPSDSASTSSAPQEAS